MLLLLMQYQQHTDEVQPAPTEHKHMPQFVKAELRMQVRFLQRENSRAD